jgi:glycosyltransferase involved in cell wall biosynthesis
MSFAVVIPMYNEEAGAEKCVRDVLDALSKIACHCELIVVDDGSSDGTPEILSRLASLRGLTVARHERNSGYGAGLKTGAREANARGLDYVLFMDADLTNPTGDIAKFARAMESGTDVIKGCRFCEGGGMVGIPIKRQIMTRAGRIVAAALFRIGVRDCTNGYRAIRTDVFMRMPLTEPGFPIIMEELYWAKRLGCTFANVPTTLYSRSKEQRQSLFGYNLRTIGAYFRYAIRSAFVVGGKSA